VEEKRPGGSGKSRRLLAQIIDQRRLWGEKAEHSEKKDQENFRLKEGSLRKLRGRENQIKWLHELPQPSDKHL